MRHSRQVVLLSAAAEKNLIPAVDSLDPQLAKSSYSNHAAVVHFDLEMLAFAKISYDLLEWPKQVDWHVALLDSYREIGEWSNMNNQGDMRQLTVLTLQHVQCFDTLELL